MAVRAVVFDLDGTLVDTLADVADGMNRALAEHGFATHSLAAYRGWIGGGAADLARRATPPASASDPVLASFHARYRERLVVHSRPYPGIDRLLVELRRRRRALAVLSNKPDEPTRRIVAGLFAGVFDEVRGQRDGVPRKPDPTALLQVAAALGVPVAEVAMVGDAATDVATARNGGALPVGVTWGYRPEAELVEAGAARLARDADELRALLLEA